MKFQGHVIEVINFNRALVTTDDIKRPIAIHLARDAASENARFLGHACLIAVGTPVTYTVEGGDVFNVSFDIEIPEIDDAYKEMSRVSIWHEKQKPWGFAARPCGCHIFLNSEDVITEGYLRGPSGDRRGSLIEHKVIVQNDWRVRCTEVSIYQD